MIDFASFPIELTAKYGSSNDKHGCTHAVFRFERGGEYETYRNRFFEACALSDTNPLKLYR